MSGVQEVSPGHVDIRWVGVASGLENLEADVVEVGLIRIFVKELRVISKTVNRLILA